MVNVSSLGSSDTNVACTEGTLETPRVLTMPVHSPTEGALKTPKGSLLGLYIHQGPCAWTQPFTMSSMGSSEYSRSRDTEGNYLLVETDIQQGPGSMVLRVYVHMSAR